MSDPELSGDEIVLVTTRRELATLAGAINEAIEAVQEWEFQTRLGVTMQAVGPGDAGIGLDGMDFELWRGASRKC